MRSALTKLFVCMLLHTIGYANITPHTPQSRIKITDSGGKGKLVVNSDIGSASDAYDGTIELDAGTFFNRRVEDGAGLGSAWYLKNATVITGTSRAYVSAQYLSEGSGSDQLDSFNLSSASDGLTFVRFEPGQERRLLEIAAGAGTVWIQGSPMLFKPIKINNPVAAPVHTIRWGLTGKLNQSVQLPDATLPTGTTTFILDNDLRLGDGVAFLPNLGNHPANSPELLISFSNSKLALGGEDLTWRSTVYFEKAGDVELNANLSLDATWLFSGNAMIQGNGNWIDLRGTDASNTGTIAIDRGTLVGNSNTTTLFFRDVKLRLRNGALQTHERTVLDLSNVEIELENSVNFTSGNIHISGPTMIYSKNHTFSISHGATMTVDGTVLYYDSGQHYNKKGVFPNDILDDDKTAMGEALNFQNDGYIQMIAKPEVTLIVSAGGFSGQTTGNVESGAGNVDDPYTFTVDKNMWLSGDVQLIFDNMGVVGGGDGNYYRFDGDNHFLHLAREANCIVLREDVQVSFVNTVFKDFDPSAFNLQGGLAVGTQVFFGQGCVLEFGADVELGTATDSLYTLSIKLDTTNSPGDGTPGDENIVKINGQGHSLSLPYVSGQSTPGQILLLTSDHPSGIRLDLENITIDKLGGWPQRLDIEHSAAQICSVQHTNTVLYRNAQLNLSSNYSYSHGSMIIDGIVHIDTRNNVDTNDPEGDTTNVFAFQPARQSVMTFSHNAKLIVGRNVTFSVDPIITDGITIANAGTVEYTQPYKSIVFDDDAAVMHFNASTLHVTATGLYFQKGAVNIENNVTWFAGTENHGEDTSVQQRILVDTGNPVSLNLLAGATLDVQGPVHYASS